MAIISGGTVIEGAQPRQQTVVGAPTNGTSGTFAGSAPIGSLLVDITNADVYQNTNTVASPTWTLITDAGANIVTPATLKGTDAAVVADVNVIGGVPILFRIDLAAGANADTNVTMTHKIRVINAWLVLRGAGVASCVLTVKSTGNAITDGMAASGADTTVVRAGTIDDANYEIAAAGVLRVTSSGGASQPAATVYVLAIRVT